MREAMLKEEGIRVMVPELWLKQERKKFDALVYDRDYFERGIETGKSCYQNYRWIPELTIPMAMTIVDYLRVRRGERILDYGCAKGYLVKALRWLGRESWGIDISQYALANLDSEVENCCATTIGGLKLYNKNLNPFHVCIAKDVLEHLGYEMVEDKLEEIREWSSELFAVIPLGSDGHYYAKNHDLDIGHIICENEDWWVKKFEECGWILKNMCFRINGIKDSYAEIKKAFGFFTLGRYD